MKTLKIKTNKGLLVADPHYGAKDANKERGWVHNNDTSEFIDHVITSIKADPEIDSIFLLGDWNQNRTAINLETLKFSYEGAKKLNSLGMPVYIILGNHDLYRRNSREIHSIHFFEQFSNFTLIEDPLVLENEGLKNILMCPFLMHGEETQLTQYTGVPIWFGHFEFDGYQVTGYGMEMVGGIDPDAFQGPEIIVSGHFHKRQAKKKKNIVYMGNPFPTSFGDAGDVDRGYATYDFRTDEIEFFNWDDAPRYIKTTLSKILDGDFELAITNKSYVKCVVDIPITWEESSQLQKEVIAQFSPREFMLEETYDISDAISETEAQSVKELDGLATIDDMVVKMFEDIETPHIDNDTLIAIYKGLD